MRSRMMRVQLPAESSPLADAGQDIHRGLLILRYQCLSLGLGSKVLFLEFYLKKQRKKVWKLKRNIRKGLQIKRLHGNLERATQVIRK